MQSTLLHLKLKFNLLLSKAQLEVNNVRRIVEYYNNWHFSSVYALSKAFNFILYNMLPELNELCKSFQASQS